MTVNSPRLTCTVQVGILDLLDLYLLSSKWLEYSTLTALRHQNSSSRSTESDFQLGVSSGQKAVALKTRFSAAGSMLTARQIGKRSLSLWLPTSCPTSELTFATCLEHKIGIKNAILDDDWYEALL